jgi:NADPH:quinone reductase-like Zn-dependent oxidoreductase
MATMRAVGKLNRNTYIRHTTSNHKTTDIKDGKGPISNMFINDIPRPKITGAQALVKVKAFGLNRMDLMQREGHYPMPPQAPATMGVEFSGTVEELGADSEHSFKKGDAVFGLAYGGAYAEYIAVSTHMLVHKPEELSWEECAGIPEVCCLPYSRTHEFYNYI